jgi:ribosomal protein S18 acetylase RimI-like enzyme
MKIKIRPMTMRDYEQALDIWENTPGIGISSADHPEKIARFLERNPGLSFVACDGGRVIGTVLGGHDGRRGYLYHMAVREDYRKKGIARQLGDTCLAALKDAGMEKCHIFVYSGNEDGINFWKQTGWIKRDELIIMSYPLEEGA